MDDLGPLTLLMNVAGPILLGVAMAVALFYTWRRRQNPTAQRRTEDATRHLYAETEAKRANIEDR
jgi:hypothetical protein